MYNNTDISLYNFNIASILSTVLQIRDDCTNTDKPSKQNNKIIILNIYVLNTMYIM